jgi:hypothetical protein
MEDCKRSTCPKKGDKFDSQNYRPIALISVVSKVFERYVNEHIMFYLEENKILSDRQYGFPHKRSTGDLKTYVSHMWNKALEQHGESYVVALDIGKTFEKVWHEYLRQK